jgi:hypothetical protein
VLSLPTAGETEELKLTEVYSDGLAAELRERDALAGGAANPMPVLARRQAHGDEEAFPLGVHERERYTAVARGL